jgi:hypothetical protein
MTRAAAATIGDSAVVIGVVVAGEARAYSIDAMRMPPEAIGEDAPDIDYFMKRHVVNDLIGGVPVSITYCDLTRQVRVLTDASRNCPLPLCVAGQRDGQMLLLFEGTRYLQNDEAIPLDDLCFEVTTWTQWEQHHPQTTIYAGDLQSN